MMNKKNLFLFLSLITVGTVISFNLIFGTKSNIPVISQKLFVNLPGKIIATQNNLDSISFQFTSDNSPGDIHLSIENKNELKNLLPEESFINRHESPSGNYDFTDKNLPAITSEKQQQFLPTEGRSVFRFAWSPDSNFLAYSLRYNDYSGTSDEQCLYLVYDLKSHKSYRLLKDPYYCRTIFWLTHKS